jgi:hypothetical protein
MSTEAPQNTEESGRILPFTPRAAPPKPHAFSNLARKSRSPSNHVPPTHASANSSVRDLSKFSEPRNEPDDFSHRMRMNAMAVIVLAVLIGSGMWIVDVMAQMRRDQDCALSGRRNCTPIAIPDTSR